MDVSDANEAVRPGEVGLVEPRDFVSQEPFTCDDGSTLPGFTLRYEQYGRLSPKRDNVVLVCHALSGDHHVAGVHALSDRKPGWWNHMIGPGKPINTSELCVICSNCLGGCNGSTGPASINPKTGHSYGLDFPLVTIRDMVRAQRRLLDHLGVPNLAAVIGGSMGGMQVLQWMIEYPTYVKRALPMATTARQNAQAIGFNEVGRAAICQDPGWNNGHYGSQGGPAVGLAVARMMAHITYLSNQGLEEKFGRQRKVAPSSPARQQFDVEFQVESYLRYQGQSFVNRFDANTYLYFSKALDRFDLFDVQGALESTFAEVQARCLVVGFTSDWLFPPEQNRLIVDGLLRAGKDASYAEVEMSLGHDSFLVESEIVGQLVRTFLEV
ncbi:MAG: homoserine O-acetyltransferase [Opitutales bacterium]